MKARLVHDSDGGRVHVLVFDKDDEVMSTLSEWATEQGVKGSSLSGIGAFSHAKLGFFEPQRKGYKEILIEEQVEVLSFLGDIAHRDGEPEVHAHVVAGLADGTTRGGHLFEGRVWPTLELIVAEFPSYLPKHVDQATGLALIGLQRR